MSGQPSRLLAVLVIGSLAAAAGVAQAGLPLVDGRVEGEMRLAVEHADPGAFGLATAPASFTAQLRATLSDPPAVSPPPDGDYEVSIDLFRLSIGDTSWDESMDGAPPSVRFRNGTAVGLLCNLTVTNPGHPDVSFFFPSSPAAWEALDEVDGIDNGTISGSYVLASPVPVLPGWSPVALSALMLVVGAALVGTRR